MERRVIEKVSTHTQSMKDEMRDKIKAAMEAIGSHLLENKVDFLSGQINTIFKNLIQEMYELNSVNLSEDDFMKRKRAKNIVPFYDRCRAKRANGEQCTRRKKDGIEYCGTHSKGTPHGILEGEIDVKDAGAEVVVWAQEIKGIIYYIDAQNNVYEQEDIMMNHSNPKVIAKYEMIEDDEGNTTYSIPEFNI